MSEIEVGSIWKEKDTGRWIKILQKEVYGTGPSWTYCDERGYDEPHSPAYPEWFWHYCDLWDFIVWKRFERVG